MFTLILLKINEDTDVFLYMWTITINCGFFLLFKRKPVTCHMWELFNQQ